MLRTKISWIDFLDDFPKCLLNSLYGNAFIENIEELLDKNCERDNFKDSIILQLESFGSGLCIYSWMTDKKLFEEISKNPRTVGSTHETIDIDLRSSY